MYTTKTIFLIFLLMMTTNIWAQKKEKVKGSKIVVTEINELDVFETIEIDEKLEIHLLPSEVPKIEIEADENLQEIFQYEVTNKTFKLRTNKKISSAKKILIRLHYTDALKRINVKGQVTFKALADITLPELEIHVSTNAKMFANVKVPNFKLVMDEKSKMELNLTATDANINLNKNSELKALIYAKHFKADLYQKAIAIIEGDVENFITRIDNSVEFIGKKLTAKNISVKIDNFARCSLLAKEQINIEASGRSEISIFGEPKIILDKFTDDAVIRKKSK